MQCGTLDLILDIKRVSVGKIVTKVWSLLMDLHWSLGFHNHTTVMQDITIRETWVKDLRSSRVYREGEVGQLATLFLRK
jgi:hypothetical protein